MKDNTQKFLTWAELSMPNLVGKNKPLIEEFDFGSTLEYQLKEPMDIEDAMNIFEDDMDLTIVYCAQNPQQKGRISISAVTKPVGVYMFKFNVVADEEQTVTSVTCVIYDSLDEMADEVLADLRNLEDNDFIFIHKVEDGILTALFCE